MARPRLAPLALLLVALSGAAGSLPVQRITDDDVDLRGGVVDGVGAPFKRNPITSRGQILFADVDDNVWLFDGALPAAIINDAPGGDDSVSDTVFMLGTHSVAGEVIAAWRRGNGYGQVSVEGGTASDVDLNPEAVSVADGCVFMVLQTAAEGNHAFRINPATGVKTQLSSGNPGPNMGALRIASTQCKAAWTFLTELQYWNGTTTTVLEPNATHPRMAGGWMAYTKVVGGIEQVFVIDTADPTLTPVQVSDEDGTKPITHLQNDGRHVLWMRGTPDVDAEVVLAGGLTFPTPVLDAFSNERGVQLDRGQVFWKTSADAYQYFDGVRVHAIDPAPATTVSSPWLADGYIAFLGLHEDGGTDHEVFRVTGTPPVDSEQPAPPLYVKLTPGASSITVEWDRVLGAASYNLYVANEPGVTEDNYATLEGGVKIEGVTSPHALTGLATNKSYFIAVTAVAGTTEGPASRYPASAVLPGDLQWTSVGSLGSTTFFSLAADPTDPAYVFAGSGGAVYRSLNGGLNWTEELSAATTGANRIAAIDSDGARAFAIALDEGDIYRSDDDGDTWTLDLDAGNPGELNGSVAIAPSDGTIVYAGDFSLPKLEGDSYVIRRSAGGTPWAHTSEGPQLGDEIHAYALAIDPADADVVYAGGSGTPNLAKSTDGGENWIHAGVPGFGAVYSIAVDPFDSNVIYATIQHRGVFRSLDGGATWEARNSGLGGVSEDNFGGAGFHSILVDPQNPNYLHLGAGNGYWYSTDGGGSWTAANTGLPGGTAWIYALAMTPARRLIAATDSGLYLLSLGPAPEVVSVTPADGDVAGGTSVTITGSGFQSDAEVAFDTEAATGVVVTSSTTITATTPPGDPGPVNVVVTNFDGQSGVGIGAFTYTTTPPPAPTGVVATASTATSVAISWNPAPRATSYEVFRQGSAGVVSVGTTASTALTDSTASGATSYLYRVRASNSAGDSPDSAADLATTVIFANDPLVAFSTRVRALHMTQAHAGIDAVRELAGLDPHPWTAIAIGMTVDDAHVIEMRTALDEARDALSLPTPAYTNGVLAATRIKAVHVQEIRDRVK